jgi:outer membrane autotransporter protein
MGVSGDGAVVVGESATLSISQIQAFRWTSGSGMVGLGTLPGGTASFATATNSNGSVVVGGSSAAGTNHQIEAFRWTQSGGMVGLGFLANYNSSTANAVSANGSVVVGCSGQNGVCSGAFRWTAATGIQSIETLLPNLTGWRLTSANAVSADGSIIAGVGIDPAGDIEGWIARIRVINLLTSLLPANAPNNVTSVAATIDNFTSSNGTLPAGFQAILSLPQSQIVNALTQLSGEEATGTQLSGFQLMNHFMALLVDPLAGGRGFGAGALPFAPDQPQTTFTPEVANAYASVLKAPAAPIPAYGAWRAWGAAYGGTNSITGDPVVVGSHDVRTSAGGFAAGLDYRVSPDTVLGAAFAGAATGWNLSAGLGSGSSDAFQAGIYAKHQFGPAYLAGALAFANYWASTTRVVTVAGSDTLKASFDAQSLGGRLEGGYRLGFSQFTLTPYTALQAQSFRLPDYSETAASGSAQFALAYAGQASMASRTELGTWLSHSLPLASGDTLALFGRAAWAHDWFSNLAVTPSFQALPGASFVVNSAAPPHDLALVAAGAEWRMRNNWSLMGRFDGEFGDGQRTYTGTARVRYAW